MELRLRAADDWHIHLRNDARTATAVAAVRHGGTARVLAMPNTLPAVGDGAAAAAYADLLRRKGADFAVHTTIKLTGATTDGDLRDAARAGVSAVKLYPMGVTTNAEDGVSDFRALYPRYEAMRDLDLVLSLHGEVPGAFVMDAEEAFLAELEAIHACFPGLRIVLEHITTRAAVELVQRLGDNVAATITDHHLAITLDDVVGSRIQPHHFCMPVAKRPEDRRALNEIVKAGHPSFFSGTDSAPHLPEEKENACGCAGIFNSPFHMQFLATHFNQAGMLECLADFTSRFGADFYRAPPTGEEIALIPEPFTVPDRFGTMVPFAAGKTLDYRLQWLSASR